MPDKNKNPVKDDKSGDSKSPPRILVWIAFLVIIPLVLLILHHEKRNNQREQLTYGQLRHLVTNNLVIRGVITHDPQYEDLKKITGIHKAGDWNPDGTFVSDESSQEEEVGFWIKSPILPELNEAMLDSGKFEQKETNTLLIGFLTGLLPFVIIAALIYFLIFRQIKMAGKGALSFGKSKARMLSKDKNRTTFKNVAGVEEAKEEVSELVEFLKDPKKFQKLGGKIPKGVLMIGAPGTGKTLLAKAIAGEADASFFSISGSDFVEMFVGVGASRVRDMFEQARKNTPCLIFIDEIDAVGRSRGHGLGGGNDEREQTLNALLVEMDGFDTQEGIIIIAATNPNSVYQIAYICVAMCYETVYHVL